MDTENRYIIKADHILPLLRKLQMQFEILAPIPGRGKDILFGPLKKIEDVIINYNQMLPSPKNILFPQIEYLFNYESKNIKEYKPENFGKILFGLHSCDVKSIKILSDFFLRQPIDNYFKSRLENITLINIVCTNPFDTSFCESTRSGPYLKSGFDLQLTPMENKYLIEIGSQKGAELIKNYRWFFKNIYKTEIEEQFEIFLQAEGKLNRGIDFSTVVKRIQNKEIEFSFWETLALNCVDCGSCTYICPVCTCFNVVDKAYSDNTGDRVRVWDACTYRGFTEMAGGSNPRKSLAERLRHKFLHKLLYTIKDFNYPGCVGCGRCDICFGHIGMYEVAKKIINY
ncbi:4Fe-4S dicluster domain-containing protein [Candidatus Desantisbacteria bacterium]|nr:4Fe-4S dicluster domain-containing protein [Candidatus Desantisbacteria bacterium]